MIVLGGDAAIEQAAKEAGHDVKVPFYAGTHGRIAGADRCEFLCGARAESRRVPQLLRQGISRSPAEMLVDRANLLTLTVPEMTVLVGGMRALNANAGQSAHGVFTDRPGTLSNDFFVNLLDMSTQWTKSAKSEGIYEGRDRASGKLKWTATPVDLIFGSNSELRAVAEVYAATDGQEKFVQ